MKAMTVGDRIQMMCTLYGISQATLSAISGVKLTVINKAARNVYVPGPQVLRSLSGGLQVSEPWFAFGMGQIFNRPVALITLTALTGKVQGSRRAMLSPQKTYDIASYLFKTEGLNACRVVHDGVVSDVDYYICHSRDGRLLIIATDIFTVPAMERLLTEWTDITVTKDRSQSDAVLLQTISKLYFTEKDMDVDEAIALVGREAGLIGLKRGDIVSPGTLATENKVQMLVGYMRELRVSIEDIEAAARLYPGP